MVKSCCVKDCDIAPDGDETVFKFPRNRYLKRRWMQLTGLSSKPTADTTICIKHFHKADYNIVKGQPQLKSKAIPSIFCEADNISVALPVTKEDFELLGGDTVLLNALRRKLCGEEDKDTPITEIGKYCDINVDNKVSAESQNGETTALDAKDTTKIQNKSRRASQIKDTTESQNEGTVGIVADDTAVSETLAKVEGDSEKDAKLLNNNVQDEGSIETEKEGSIQTDNKHKKYRRINNRSKTKRRTREAKLNGVNVVLEGTNGGKTDLGDHLLCTEPSSSAEHLNDIEDIIVNYQIKQTRPVHAADTDTAQVEDDDVVVTAMDDQPPREKDPVFIEVAVTGDRAGSPRDCLMVLESVQVELDPSTFLAHGEPDDCHDTVDLLDDDDYPPPEPPPAPAPAACRRTNSISLLTSSDEDEVILLEPHIDTVEVSDETDEDDVPLVQLLEKPKKKKKKSSAPRSPYEYFCLDCQFTASSRQEYRAHTAGHSTILQVCEVCDYTTASKSQFSRHKRKHKDDKKFKCHLCEYKARHNLSLIYHLKSHRALSSVRKGFKCGKCGFESDVKTVVLKHVKLCTSDVKKYSCDKCVYETKRPSDLRRHKARRHDQHAEDDDESVP